VLKKTPVEILEVLQREIFSRFLQDKFKMKSKNFTRDRKQSFSGTIVFMINFLTKSLSLEIVNFVAHLKEKLGTGQQAFTKSAFVQARKKISPEVFKYLVQRLAEEFYTDNSNVASFLEGFRVLAVDGSRITLPITKELEGLYGKTTNQTGTSIVQARASVLYDLANNLAIDGVLANIGLGERELALRHLEHCKNGDLIIYDRGYPSYDFIYGHYEKGLAFVMRAKSDFSNVTKSFIQSGKTSQTVEILPGKNMDLKGKAYHKNTQLKVRLLRIELPGGETELLITSLTDSKKHKYAVFKELYFRRWKIETYYDELKNKLKVEHFSGYSDQCILQDFYAAIFVSNLQSLIVSEVNQELKQNGKGMYLYKVNTALSYGFMKDRVLTVFLGNGDMGEVINELKGLLRNNLIPIRPGRSNPRKVGKYRNRIRPKVTKNQKDAI
jgi:hypothetical protein